MTPEANDASPPAVHLAAAEPVPDQGDGDEDPEVRREVEKLAPNNDRLRALIGSFRPPPGTFDDEEMPY